MTLTEEDWCDLCELPKTQCAHGLPKPIKDDNRPIIDGPIVVASHGGICPWCEERIEEGDHIGPTEDGEWIHYGCGR